MHADEENIDTADDIDLEVEDTPARGGVRRGKTDDKGRKIKGRGAQDPDDASDRYSGKGGEFMEIDGGSAAGGPVKSVEGWIIFVSGVHEEASEDDILDKFSDAGEVKSVQLPLDRRTGFVKGYALIEYESKAEAESAIRELDGTDLNQSTLHVSFAFIQAPKNKAARAKRSAGVRR